jgi:hypothetical protein
MLLKIFVAGWFAVVPPATTTCANSTTVQTQAVSGPEGATAVLKVSSEDDHAKDTHLCMADYRLLIAHHSGEPKDVELLSSDNDWGRKISIQLSGFTHDGKRIVGMLAEGGPSPAQEIFDYNSEDGNIRFFDLLKLAAHTFPARCLAFSEVLGTTDSGAVVLQLRSGKYCAHTSRWVLSSVKGPLRRVAKHEQVQELYGSARVAAH